MKGKWAVFLSVCAAVSILLFCGAGRVYGESAVVEAQMEEETVVSAGDDDAALAAEGYIRKIMLPPKPGWQAKGPSPTGARLTGANKKLYDRLYPLMAQVAAGELDSTVFSIPAEEVYDQVTFTAEELGVEVLVADGAFTEEAAAALNRVLRAFDGSQIIQALLDDCPYELYWYNKATGAGSRIAYPKCASDGQRVTLQGSVVFKMSVSDDYAAGEYLVDTAYGQAVANAAETAREIVARYAACSDYERLLAFKEEICALTSYNFEAVNQGWPYGNPWQLVWVFDGNPDTKVVCEGYSKAFQYLNDLSAGKATVISVRGKMGDGNHMWNIVTMEDGKNYLADVTNCDSGMSGYPDKLFLVGNPEGGVEAGYVFSRDGFVLRYTYGENIQRDKLRLAAWDYLAGGPPAPGFTGPGAGLFLNSDVSFAYEDNGYAYDALIASVTYRPVNGEAETHTETVTVSADGRWHMNMRDYAAGEFVVRFAGLRDGTQSGWLEIARYTVSAMADYQPTYTVSSEKGYAGYRLAVRTGGNADGVKVRETGEEIACDGNIALLPLTEAGETRFTLAVIWNGEISAFGETVTVQVAPLEAGVVHIPAATRQIEAEAFRGIGASAVIIPASVRAIGAYAFADNAALLLAKLLGTPQMDATAFDNCPQAVLCAADPQWGFAQHIRFIVE